MGPNQSTAIPFTLDNVGNPNGVVFDMSPVDLGGALLGPYAVVVSDCPGTTVPISSRCQANGIESASLTMNNTFASLGVGCGYVPGRQYYLNIRPTSSTGTTLVVYTRK